MRFNPFEDRLSRDVRNDLSETIIEVLESQSLTAAETVADGYRHRNLDAPHIDYIDDRLTRYGQALERLKTDSNLLNRAAVLWDLRLFFEVHEILEPAWMEAGGDEKRLLQALIRAAGAYINLELGYGERARKISAKALPVLEELGEELTDSIDVQALITALKTLPLEPPLLSLGES